MSPDGRTLLNSARDTRLIFPWTVTMVQNEAGVNSGTDHGRGDSFSGIQLKGG